MRLPDIIEKELERAGDRWRIEQGGRHKHIVIDGQLVAILPNGGCSDRTSRGTLNFRSQIRRHLNQFPA